MLCSNQPLVFPFKKRPFITVSFRCAISCHSGSPSHLTVDALLDSGADRSFFPPKMLYNMGHIPSKGKSISSIGIEQSRVPCKIHTCAISMIKLKPFEIKVSFPDPDDTAVKRRAAILNGSLPVIGREDFFDKFKIVFYGREKIVMLFPLKSLIA